MTEAATKPHRVKPFYAGAYVRGGKLVLDDTFDFNTRVKRIPDDTRVQVSVGPPKRSDEANNYYWLTLAFIEEHGEGHTDEEFHEYFKMRFLPKRVAIADGNGEVRDDVVIGGSTANLTRHEFYVYVEKVRHFALMELGIQTPDPDPKLAKKFKQATA